MVEQEKYLLITDALRAKAAEILPKGSQVTLYGSRARGDSRADSDWDLQILIPGDEKLSVETWEKYAWPFSDLGLEFNEIINPRLYSFISWLKRSILPFYKNVENEKILLFQN